MKPEIIIIVAFSKNGRIIGNNGRIPWTLPEDLRHFKELTTGNAIIMGRKTFESIGRVLPERMNIIVTRNKDFCVEDAYIAKNPEKAIEIAKKAGYKKIFICGGQQIYQQMMNYADYIYATEVCGEYEGDAFFPEINENEFVEVKREKCENHESKMKWEFVYFNRNLPSASFQ